MRITYIRLENFIGVHAAMGLKEVEFSFENIDKPIIQIYGHNRCGKTVLIQQLHPFSSISLNGDERSDLSLILPKEVGIKNIVYEVDGEVYNITHTYQPSKTSHTVSSSIVHNGEELNPSGGVTTFNSLIERILGINKYVFSFIINGTNLTSFGNMSTTQRKNLLNKAMGIDIYDKIHKMATDDYRYTNKIITSLNNTKEYILSTYGSYESLCALLKQKQDEFNTLTTQESNIEKRMNVLYGEMSAITNQHPDEEIVTVNNQLDTYERVVEVMGSYDPDMYDKLVQEQIKINNDLSTHKNERLMIRKDIDILYSKKNDIQNTIMQNRRAAADFENMIHMRDDLVNKIDNIGIKMHTDGSSSYYRSMIQPAQAINDICTEIVSCLNENHLKMFTEMVINGIDIAAFLMQEGSVLMDSEKEKSAVSRVRRMIEGVEGDFVDKECAYGNCIYRKTHKMLETYFKSYQSSTSSQFTQYDLEQIEHAHKNVLTLKRLLNIEISVELKDMFDLNNIMLNVQNKKFGIDVAYIKYLMEEAAKNEQKLQYISQLNSIKTSIENMEKLLIPTDNADEAIKVIDDQITELNNKDVELSNIIDNETRLLDDNDRQRVLLSQVKHINVPDLTKRRIKLTALINQLNEKRNEYNGLQYQINDIKIKINEVTIELKTISDAYNQYVNTVAEIDKHDSVNGRYKVIAEATSSTKGKPVLAIRDIVENALSLTNRLLDIMYDGEIELLDPIIDESSFTLPFRCGSHTSSDIRYGSQSESTLLSLALEMSLSASLSQYNVCLIDEIDAYLDPVMHSSYLMMLQETMATLKMEQLFLISHSVQPGQYDHIVHTIDLSKK